MAITIGTAPDAWGVWFPEDSRQTPWQRFLDEVAEAGYEWIELGPYGYLPTTSKTLGAELDTRGHKLCACMVEANLEDPAHWQEVEKQLLGGGELTADLGGEYLVLMGIVISRPVSQMRLCVWTTMHGNVSWKRWSVSVEMGVFCELPDGIVDYLQVRDVLQDVGYSGFAIVEQDMFPAPLDAPLPIATRARTYLKEFGIG